MFKEDEVIEYDGELAADTLVEFLLDVSPPPSHPGPPPQPLPPSLSQGGTQESESLNPLCVTGGTQES